MNKKEVKAVLDKMAAMIKDIEVQTQLLKAYCNELKKLLKESEEANDDH